jgi:uncharacterized membrane protein
MRGIRWLSPALLAAGIAWVAVALAEGSAHLALFVVFPVIFGSSVEFGVGVLLFVLGLFTLPLLLDVGDSPEPGPADSGSPEPTGGVVVIGPVPIFFGSWRNVSLRTRVTVAAVGAAVLVVVVLAVVGLLR